jgi:predicted phage terminase large subunit-like protein
MRRNRHARARQLVDAWLREDLAPFTLRTYQTVSPGSEYLHNWHIEAITYQLQRCFRREINRLIITVPPRHLKSICASVAFPAWMLGQDPRLKIICASYANELTVKHARDCRSVMESDWYRRAFPKTRLESSAELELITTRGGFRFGTSVGGTLTGRGGNFIIIDDPLKPQDAMSEVKRDSVQQWYDSTLYSRLDSKKDDVIIIVMQRLHVDDLVGYVIEKENWTHLDLPAIAEAPQTVSLGGGRAHRRAIGDVLHPEREPLSILDGIKAQMGSQAFSAQYQQAPVPPGGAMIQWSWFKTYRELPWRDAGDELVQSWDTAAKADELNDFSVGTTWLVKGNNYYLADVVRERLLYPELRRRIIETANRNSCRTVIIEDKGSGTSLIQDLKGAGQLWPIAFRPEGDKITRLAAQSAKIEAGHVHLPEHASWLGDFKTEMMRFPYGRHDDQVDSVSQFLSWIEERRKRVMYVRPIVGLY